MLSIVVPARDEERQIEICVRSLLAQTYPSFEVIVVDDRSDDGTREILTRIAREDARLHVIDGAPLPSGWVGKPWALSQGIDVACGTWLLTTDADTEHEPEAAGSALVYTLREKLDACSLLTDQVMSSPAERLILPSILWTIAFAIGPLDDVADPAKPQAAIFNGQYVLMSRATYDAFGGYARLRSEIAEDLELSRLLKREGYKIALASANGLVRTRMYRAFGEIWAGFVKNFALGAPGRPLPNAAGATGLALISPVTPLTLIVCAWYGHPIAALILAIAMLAAMASAEYGMRAARFPRGSGWTLPAGIAVTLAILLTSLARRITGRGVSWRGRTYKDHSTGAPGVARDEDP